MEAAVPIAPLEHPRISLRLVHEPGQLVIRDLSWRSPPSWTLLCYGHLIPSHVPTVPHLVTCMWGHAIAEDVEPPSHPHHFKFWDSHQSTTVLSLCSMSVRVQRSPT